VGCPGRSTTRSCGRGYAQGRRATQRRRPSERGSSTPEHSSFWAPRRTRRTSHCGREGASTRGFYLASQCCLFLGARFWATRRLIKVSMRPKMASFKSREAQACVSALRCLKALFFGFSNADPS